MAGGEVLKGRRDGARELLRLLNGLDRVGDDGGEGHGGSDGWVCGFKG